MISLVAYSLVNEDSEERHLVACDPDRVTLIPSSKLQVNLDWF